MQKACGTTGRRLSLWLGGIVQGLGDSPTARALTGGLNDTNESIISAKIYGMQIVISAKDMNEVSPNQPPIHPLAVVSISMPYSMAEVV